MKEKQANIDRIRGLIESYVWDILCSRRWTDSMKMEVCFICWLCLFFESFAEKQE